MLASSAASQCSRSVSRRSFHSATSKLLVDVHQRMKKGPQLGHLQEGAAMPFQGAPLNREETILKTSIGNARALSLNNPRNFNRMNATIAHELLQQVRMMNTAPFVRLIALQSTGAQAHSFGLDFQAIYTALQENDRTTPAQIAREVAKLSFYTATCETPTLAVLTGSVFGAGVALGCFGDYVIATPGTKYAVPEVSFGYIPDAGNTFLLKSLDQRYPGLGMFLALTGAQITGTDLIHCGIATHLGMGGATSTRMILDRFSSDEHTQDKSKLRECVLLAVENEDAVQKQTPSFLKDLPHIKQCFSNKKKVEDILAELQVIADQRERGDNVVAVQFARRTLAAMRAMSPVAIKAAFQLLNTAITEDLPVADCYNLEFRVAQHIMNQPDFAHGLRALIENDGALPTSWPSAPSIEQVSDSLVRSFIDTELSLAAHATCDLAFPTEAFMEDTILRRVNGFSKKNEKQ